MTEKFNPEEPIEAKVFNPPVEKTLSQNEIPESFDFHVSELKNKRYILKEAKLGGGESFSENLERLRRSLELIKNSSLSKFLPYTKIILSPDRKIYFVQEKVTGQTLENLLKEKKIKTSIKKHLSKELDRLISRSFEMWFITNRKKLHPLLPKGIGFGPVIRKIEDDEGMIPEIINLKNIIIGRIQKDKLDKKGGNKVYLVDSGFIIGSGYEIVREVKLSDLNDLITKMGDSLPLTQKSWGKLEKKYG